MHITLHHPDDLTRLQPQSRRQRDAKQRDRYRAVLLAREGHDAPTIARFLGRSRAFVLDQAGWHLSKGLRVPANVTLLHLPPYLPELNPVERLWAYLRSHYLSDRAYQDYDDLFTNCRNAWNRLTPE
jgi:transposase